MKENYVCNLCGATHTDLDAFLNCVSTCGTKLKKQREEEKNKKRIEEINATLNGVRQAKKYYEDKLNEFKTKYPEEYKVNFVKEKTEQHVTNYPKDIYEILYSNDGDKSTVSAKLNGKEVSDFNTLLNDPYMTHIAELLGLV